MFTRASRTCSFMPCRLSLRRPGIPAGAQGRSRLLGTSVTNGSSPLAISIRFESQAEERGASMSSNHLIVRTHARAVAAQPAREIFIYSEPAPVKRHRGGPGHDTGHTGHTGARGHTDHTDEPHNNPPKPNDTPARPRDGRNCGRLNSRKNSRRPGVDRSLRPTQKRPPPANPTLPPPAPRAPPRACSKAVGEMKARAADA